MQRPKFAAAAGIVALALSGIGCSSGGEEPVSGVPRSPSAENVDRNPKMLRGSGRIAGENACLSAKRVALQKLGEIRFEIRCAGREEGKIAFAIDQAAPDDVERQLPIVRFAQHPIVLGPGATSKRGLCWAAEGQVLCAATIDGKVRIIGTVTVRATNRCWGEIHITGITSSGCEAEYCSGRVAFARIFRGRPQGCA